MSGQFYTLVTFLVLYWFFCLYVGFKNQKKIVTPVDFFLFGRQLPGWSFFPIITSTIFSGWIFFLQPSLTFLNGLPFASTSLFVIAIPLIGILFSKKQWQLSRKFGYVTPAEMISDYFKSDILRILIVVIALGFSIPFIAMNLSLGGMLFSIITDNIIGFASGAILIGAVITTYLCTGGIKSIIYIDSIQFLLIVFAVLCIGFVTYDLVGGWSLLNESLSRISSLKMNLFNTQESYNAYLSVPGTIKAVNIVNENLSYNGIWTSGMILTFIFALTGIQMSPNISMLTFASKDSGYFGTQQVWFSGFLIGFIVIFFTTAIGIGSTLLGGNNSVNESGNNISNILPPNIYPDNAVSIVPHIINLVGEYSFFFFGILAICAIASIQSTSSLYLTSSAIVTRDIIKRFFVKNLINQKQVFCSKIVIMSIFLISLILSILSNGKIIDLGSFALAIACQMFVPLIALCYFPWFTKQGVSFGIFIGIITVFLTESIGQVLFGNFVFWSKWPLTIHSSVWGMLASLIGSVIISFITQDMKETKNKKKFHDFINENKNYSLARRSLKPSAWIIFATWTFFAVGPGLLIGNELFGKPLNVESWSFGIPSIWVWNILFWVLGILMVWFLAIKMEMSTSMEKNISPYSDDFSN
tara:strand:+ start:206 stop:2128 length:1923 start_codon:yes stop_codon:yes gene_type:complete